MFPLHFTGSRARFVFFLLISIFVLGCGQLKTKALGDTSSDDGTANITPGSETVFLFATDFFTGQLYSANADKTSSFANTDLTTLGSSAVIHFFDGLLYILSDGYSSPGNNNLQIIDPAKDFKTINQFSTGPETNPQDFVVIGDKAYISLYDPQKDADNVDSKKHPADVIVMSTKDGSILKRLSFYTNLSQDSDIKGRAGSMVLVGTDLYVALQDLDGDGFSGYHQTVAGKIGVIDTTTDKIDSVITLKGRNPVDLAYSSIQNKLYVALQAPFDSSFQSEFETDDHGGIEIVPLDDTANTVLLPDNDLGGYVERLLVHKDELFVVSSILDENFNAESTLYVLPADSTESDDLESLDLETSDIREIAADSLDRLWIARRTINATTHKVEDPRVDLYDLTTDKLLTDSLSPSIPVTSITMGVL